MDGRSNRPNPAQVEQIIGSLKAMKKLRELDPLVFAPEDGWADQIVLAFGKDLNVTQLRKFFHRIKRVAKDLAPKKEDEKLENRDKHELVLLIPDLAYAVGRKLIPREFYNLLKTCLAPDKMEEKKDFTLFNEFISAIVGFHKLRSMKDQGER